MFERKEGNYPPLKYKVGDKIMGYHSSMGMSMLVGGTIVNAIQSKSFLDENEYEVLLRDEVTDGEKGAKWTISEKEAKDFDEDLWLKAAEHWKKHNALRGSAYREYLRMHRALRGEDDKVSDEELDKRMEK